jgi:hypothetical protein
MAVGPAALGLDEIPLIAQVGEGILSRRGMVAGEQLVRELNAGRVPGRGGDDEFLLPLTIPIEGEAVVKALVKVRRARRWG